MLSSYSPTVTSFQNKINQPVHCKSLILIHCSFVIRTHDVKVGWVCPIALPSTLSSPPSPVLCMPGVLLLVVETNKEK